jgi:hypothetical protein
MPIRRPEAGKPAIYQWRFFMNPTEEQIERARRVLAFTAKALAEVDPRRGPMPIGSGMDEATLGLSAAKTVFENFLRQHGDRRR